MLNSRNSSLLPVPFVSARKGGATTSVFLPNYLSVRCRAFVKTGDIFGEKGRAVISNTLAYSQSLNRSERCKKPLADGLQFVVIKR